MIEIVRTYEFEATHNLKKIVPKDHQFYGDHTHQYQVEIHVNGEVNDGMIVDYNKIDDAWENRCKSVLDDSHLNEIYDLEYTTVEELAPWIGRRIQAGLPSGADVAKVVLHETPRSKGVYSAQRG